MRVMQYYGSKYPFLWVDMVLVRQCCMKESKPYNSWGNGSAMRVSPVDGILILWKKQ